MHIGQRALHRVVSSTCIRRTSDSLSMKYLCKLYLVNTNMGANYIRVLADVRCDWDEVRPIYRVFVDDELFAERTWIWTGEYLEELLQIEAEPGKYKVRYELVGESTATLHVENIRVEHGSATIINGNTIKVHDEIL